MYVYIMDTNVYTCMCHLIMGHPISIWAKYVNAPFSDDSPTHCHCGCMLFYDLQDFNRHCKEINSKIITIMDDLISRHLNKVEHLASCRWCVLMTA